MGTINGTIEVYDFNKGLIKTFKAFNTVDPGVQRLKRLSKNLMAGTSFEPGGAIKIWNTTNWNEEFVYNQPTQIYDIEYINDQTIAISDHNSIQLISLNENRILKKVTINSQVFCLVSLLDGNLASGDDSNQIRMWNLNSSSCKDIGCQIGNSLKGHKSFVLDLELICTTRLASASNDRTIIIWDLLRREKLFQLKGHRSGVTVLKYVSEIMLLASGSKDGTIRMWDINDGELKETERLKYIIIHGYNKSDAIYWSLDLFDKTTLVSGSENGIVKFWHVNSTYASLVHTITSEYYSQALSTAFGGYYEFFLITLYSFKKLSNYLFR